jgi:hypothetical protein
MSSFGLLMHRTRGVAALVVVAALLGAASAPASATRVRPPGATQPLGTERLSDEFSVTRWAHPATTAKVRSAPKRRARVVARLHLLTEDGLPEVYVVLASRLTRDGAVWLRIRVPMRPHGRVGWVPRAALHTLYVVRTRLVINRRTLRARLWRAGRVIWSARVGVGKPGTPTPAGRFYVREALENPHSGGSLYGPYAFGTSDYSTLSEWRHGGVVGIHGTNEPGLIPGRPSHGCIRLRNADIRRLYPLLPLGTPIRIR